MKDFLKLKIPSCFGFVTLLCLSVSISLSAQNLVPNPGFEEIESGNCPFAQSTYNTTFDATIKDWYQPNKAHTDVYHSCGSGDAKPPNSVYGKEMPRNGDGMLGLEWYYRNGAGDWFDYAQVELTDSLKPNTSYEISFWVNKASYVTEVSSEIGIYISDSAFWSYQSPLASCSPGNYGCFDTITPQIMSQQFINDSDEWYEVSGEYKANGGESFITIGSFTRWRSRDSLQVPGPSSGNRCYYFLDDVSVVEIIENIADFSYENPCTQDSVFFTDLSTNPSTFDIVSWLWDFGDGFTSSDQNPFHIYNSSGTKTVKLTITDTRGRKNSIEKDIEISFPPTLNVLESGNKVCEGDSVLFEFSGADIYQWLPNSNVSNPNSNISHIKPSASSTYTLQYQQTGNNCIGKEHFYIEVIQPTLTKEKVSICEGNSYKGKNKTGIHLISYQSVFGCDSLLELNLNVMDVDTTINPVKICDNEDYNGYTSSGIYFIKHRANSGCDSIEQVNLQVLPTYSSDEQLSFCNGDSVLINGTYYHSSSTFSINYFSANGCDSVVNYELTENSKIESSTEFNLCETDSLLVNERYRYAGDVFTDTLLATNGCDSICHYTINALTVNFETDTTYICSGDSALIHGSWEKNENTFTQTFQNQFGCDSTSSIHLKVLPTYNFPTEVFICEGENYYGKKESGTSKIQHQSKTGCDSVEIVTLTVYPNYNETINHNICNGDSILITGSYRKQNGTYVEKHQSINGCDSTIRHRVIVLPQIENFETLNICKGDSIKFKGQYYHDNAIFTDTLIAQNGCDSLVYTELVGTDTNRIFQNIAICEGDSIFLENEWQKSEGNYQDLYSNKFGCDSTVVTHLVIKKHVYSNDTIEICEGDSALIHGAWENTEDLYTATFTATNECDSTSNVFLQILPLAKNDYGKEICQGESYKGLNQAGIDTLFHTGFNGCDSLEIIDLTVLKVDSIYNDVNLCEGEVYNGYSESGNYEIIHLQENGCDSLEFVTLTVYEIDSTYLDTIICEGESFKGKTSSGTYKFTEQNIHSCDSVVILNLTVAPTYKDSSVQEICNGDNYKGFTSTGVYYINHESIFACDSLEIINLITHPTFNFSTDKEICEGDNYFGYETSGTYTINHVSKFGCDSIETVDLKMFKRDFYLDTLICDGDNFKGKTESGIYSFNFSHPNNCDSILHVDLTVHKAQDLFSETSICDGESIVIHNKVVRDAGIYTTTSTDEYGCERQEHVELTVNPLPNVAFDIENYCESHSTEPVILNLEDNTDYYWKVLENGNTYNGISPKINEVDPDIYNLQLTAFNEFNCSDSSISIFEVLPLPDIKFELDKNRGCYPLEVQVFDSTSNVNQSIWKLSGLDLELNAQQAFEISSTGLFSLKLIAISSDFCADSLSKNILTYDCFDVNVPTAFTPNGDGLNDGFRVEAIYDLIEDFKIQIFNIWGEVIFEETDPRIYWDGTFNQGECSESEYPYVIEYKRADSTFREKLRGSVKLFR